MPKPSLLQRSPPQTSHHQPPHSSMLCIFGCPVAPNPRSIRSHTHDCGYQLCNSMGNLHALFIYNGKQLSNKIKQIKTNNHSDKSSIVDFLAAFAVPSVQHL